MAPWMALLSRCAQSLPYELLMRQLDISNVRELEDLLINDCMYAVRLGTRQCA